MNIFAPNVGASKYWKKMSTGLEEDTVSSTTVGGFNTPLAVTDGTARLKLNREIRDSNNPTNTYRALHPSTEQGTFSPAHLERSPG